MSDDDCWVTHTSLTPEEDEDFISTGKPLLYVIFGLVIFIALCWLVGSCN